MTFIRKFIFALPSGALFTTRDCLGFGRRGAVDTALHRLVYLGIINRLARGVFVRADKDLRTISVREVVDKKVRAFGKEVIEHGKKSAKEFACLSGNLSKYLFHVSGGNSSSFAVGGGRVHLKGTCQRRMRLGESKAGKVALALWHLGKKGCKREHKESINLRLNRADREELQHAIRWMPSWLGELLVPDRARWVAPALTN